VGRGTTDAVVPLFAGFLLGTTLARAPAAEPRALLPSGFAAAREHDPDRLCFRDLQRLPAIGPARAFEIVTARHERGLSGGPAAWSALAGIGAETVRSVAEAVEASRARDRGGGSTPERTLRAESRP
jgi:hypothetical protein